MLSIGEIGSEVLEALSFAFGMFWEVLYAAVAMARAVFRGRADFTAATAF